MLLRVPAYVLEMYFVYNRSGCQMQTSPVDTELLFLLYTQLFLHTSKKNLFTALRVLHAVAAIEVLRKYLTNSFLHV